LLGAALVACAPAAPESRWNVLLVLVDTLRADRMSLYGYARPTTPHLDRFAAASAVVFENAWAAAGCTYPSVNSLFTARAPQVFLAGGRGAGMGIPADEMTLAERLRAAGYATGAVSASVIVRATPSAINRKGGFGAGFDGFDEGCEKRSASCVNQAARRALGRLREPFFLYLHYLDPHAPYRPPAWFAESFAASGAPVKPWAARGEPETIYRALYPASGPPARDAFGAAEARHLADRYDDEVRFFDRQVGELLDELGRDGMLDRTILVLVADHGEELFEHGEWGHCRSLATEAVLRTPLLIALPPGMAEHTTGRRAALASNLDVVPTLLDLLGLEYDAMSLDGVSLRRALGRDTALRPQLFGLQGALWAARDASRFVAYDGRTERWGGDEAADLRTALLAWRAEQLAGSPGLQAVEQAEDLERELRALGYL
jgi:arylsulfatase A-like enzyme